MANQNAHDFCKTLCKHNNIGTSVESMSSSTSAGPKHSRIPRYQDMKQVSGPVLGKGPWELLANLKQQVVIHHREEVTGSRGGR